MRYSNLTLDDIEESNTFIFTTKGGEERSRLPLWDQALKHCPDECLEVAEQSIHIISVVKSGRTEDIHLRDSARFEDSFSNRDVLIDISGLAHHIWAPLLHCAHRVARTIRVVYAEPKRYRTHGTPVSPTAFDLSASFEGLTPIPGFTRLVEPETNVLVPLLGFEGNRPSYLALQMESIGGVIPIVGVPGFSDRYPSVTIACNRTFLDEYRAYSNIRLARASCPFEVIDALASIHEDFPEHCLFLAPVGTKPHSLGAVWFAICNPSYTELLYDHPVRKKDRTSGVSTIHVYKMK